MVKNLLDHLLVRLLSTWIFLQSSLIMTNCANVLVVFKKMYWLSVNLSSLLLSFALLMQNVEMNFAAEMFNSFVACYCFFI